MTDQNLPFPDLSAEPPSFDGEQSEEVYDEAMNAGHAAAWEQDWDTAIPAYMLAIRVRPEDPAAHNNLGLALLQAGRLGDAFKVYQRAHKLAPDDPVPLEKSADVLERMGRLNDAAKQYLTVAEIYLGQRDLERAIGNWERATRITGGLVEIHKKLALAYERTGRRRQAVREYLTLAGNYQMAGNSDVAVQAIERALRLEPQNPQALNALQALRSGSKVIPVSEEMARYQETAKPPQEASFDEFGIPTHDDDIGDANPDGPIGEAVDKALESLATYVFESGVAMEQSGMLTIQAIELHRQEAYSEAIEIYEQAQKNGLMHSGVSLNLGALNIAEGNWKDAIGHLERVADDSEMQAGAQHGLGIAYMQVGQVRKAARHLIQALRFVDVGMALSKSESEQLKNLYDRMLDNANHADEATLVSMNERFFDLLTGVDWKKNIELTRGQLEDAMSEDPTTLLDVASVGADVFESMGLVDEYIRNRRYHIALEEAYHIIEKEPDFLAIHLRIGDILVRLNRIQQALEKFDQISRTYLVRGNRVRAAEVLSEAIQAAPGDIHLRQSLIEMLEEDESYDLLLGEYVFLGDAYMDLADTNNARDAYNQAIAVARNLDAPPGAIAEIMHKMIDIDTMRLDMRNAMRTAEQIRQLDPSDIKARELLVDFGFRLGDPITAITELDGLLQHYAAKRDGNAIIRTLQKWAQERPDDEAIRSRLAAIYHQIKQRDRALEQYNILLNLQLNNGRHKEACDTIKRILTLNPGNVEKYRQLQQQLGCQ